MGQREPGHSLGSHWTAGSRRCPGSPAPCAVSLGGLGLWGELVTAAAPWHVRAQRWLKGSADA